MKYVNHYGQNVEKLQPILTEYYTERIKQRIATQKCLKNPGFINHLRIFGEMGFVLTHRQIGYKSKISDKGREAFLLDMQRSMQVTHTACMIPTPRESKSAVT